MSTSYQIRLVDILGVGAVHPGETDQAIKAELYFRWPLFILAFWLPVQWFLTDKGIITPSLSNLLSWLIWLAFLLETLITVSLVRDKQRYLLSNWTNLIIIGSVISMFWSTAPFFAILRLLRLIIIPRLIITWWISR